MTKRKIKKTKKQKKGIFNKIPKEYTMALLIFMGVFISVVAVSLMISKTDVSRYLKTEIANFPGDGLICANPWCDGIHTISTNVNLAQTGKYRVDVSITRGYSSTEEACQHTCQDRENVQIRIGGNDPSYNLGGLILDNGPACTNGEQPSANCAHFNGELSHTDTQFVGEIELTAGNHSVFAVHPPDAIAQSLNVNSIIFTFIPDPPGGCNQQCGTGGTCESGLSCNANNICVNPGCDGDPNCVCPYCGDGVVDAGEECEPGIAGSCDGGTCTTECTCEADNPYCGDGVVDTGEECEPGVAGYCGDEETCTNECVCEGMAPYCGDGIVNNNEECEPGVAGYCGDEETCTDECVCESVVVPGGCNQPCGIDGSCEAGLFCEDNNICLNPICPSRDDCLCDCFDWCWDQEDCDSGLTCYFGPDGLAETGRCVDIDCPTNEYCVCGYSRVASIEIIKTADQTSVDPGTTVNYEFEVTNTGTEDLTGVEVTDPLISDIVCPQDTLDANCPVDNIIINPDVCLGESMTCTGSMVITEDTINTATATGTDPDGNDVTDSDDEEVTVILESGIEIIKTADETSVDPGTTVDYEFVVTNIGDTTLTNVTVTDPLISDISCPQTTLISGSSMICTGSMVIDEDTINTATATGTDPDGGDVTDSDIEEVEVEIDAGINIEKTVNKTTINKGETVTYIFVVTNTGNVRLIDIEVDDNKLGEIDCPYSALDPGDSMTCTQKAIVNVTTTNVVVVTAEDPEGNKIDDKDVEQVEVEEPTDQDCNEECDDDDNCDDDLVCHNGRCRNDECKGESDCECDCNDDCDDDDDCEDDLECEDGRCRNPECEDESDCECDCDDDCEDDDDCESGLDCEDGKCRNPYCEDEDDCVCKRSPTTGMGRNIAIVFSISVAITAIILLVLHKTGRFTVGK